MASGHSSKIDEGTYLAAGLGVICLIAGGVGDAWLHAKPEHPKRPAVVAQMHPQRPLIKFMK